MGWRRFPSNENISSDFRARVSPQDHGIGPSGMDKVKQISLEKGYS